MSTVREFHDAAMSLADEMLAARRRGKDRAVLRFAREAFAAELSATTLAFDLNVSAATRLILFRSAAHLARDAREWRAGMDLAARALAAEDLREYRDEVFDIIDTLRTYEHLQLEGVTLIETDIQLSVAGPDAAPGFARSDEVMRRIENVRSLAVRQAMRRAGLPFEASTPRAAQFRAVLTPYLSVPRAASYAVTVRFGVDEQVELDLLAPDHHKGTRRRPAPVALVLQDVFASVQAYARGGPTAVRDVIDDDDYARNATALLRQLSPDSERIKTVGITMTHNGQSTPIALPSRTAFDSGSRAPRRVRDALPARFETFVGELREANAIQKVPHASIVIADGDPVRFSYDEAEHIDVVAEYWKHRVRVQLRRDGTRYHLIDIDEASGQRPKRPKRA